jgi:toxin ParE1/3/4
VAEVAWTREALVHLELIRAYIRQFDPDAARRFARRLIDAGESLRDFPDRGRPAGDGKRELPIVPPYVIRYEIHGEVVYIVSIRHSRQDDPL